MNETLNLKLNLKTYKFKHQLGSDIAFFLSGFHSANVSGCGEIIKEFEDDIPNLKWTFPQISCQTKAVYDEFDRKIFDFQKNNNQAQIYKKLSTKELFKTLKTKN